MEDHRYCTQQKHQQEKIQFICMHDSCKLPRFLCSLCLYEENHKHQTLDYKKHIVTLETLNDLMSMDIRLLQKQYQKKQVEYKNVLQQMKIQLDTIQQQIHNIREHLFYKQGLWNLISEKKFSLINEDIINEIVNGKQFQIDYIIIPKLAQMIYQQPIQQQSIQAIDIKDFQYESVEIDKLDDRETFRSAALSNNGQFIAFGGSDRKLKIFNNQLKIIDQKVSNIVTKCKFSHNDQYLYVGLESDILQVSVFENFIFKIQMKLNDNNKHILDIIPISSQILLVANYKYISRVDFSTLQITLNLLAHEQYIYSIDIYQNKMISCSKDNSIKLWNQIDGQLLIDQKDVCSLLDLKQVKFVQWNQFLCLSGGRIRLWSIRDKSFEKLVAFNTNHTIYKMHLISGEQFIISFSYSKIQIINLQGEIIKEINHQINKLEKITNSIQSSNLKQILIQGTSNFYFNNQIRQFFLNRQNDSKITFIIGIQYYIYQFLILILSIWIVLFLFLPQFNCIRK